MNYSFWRDVNKCLFSPDRALATKKAKIPLLNVEYSNPSPLIYENETSILFISGRSVGVWYL